MNGDQSSIYIIQKKKSEHPQASDEGAKPMSSQMPPVSSVAALVPSTKHQQTSSASSAADKLGKLMILDF